VQTEVSFDEGFLCKVVRKISGAAQHAPQETAHQRLVPAHEFAECLAVVSAQDPRDQHRIGFHRRDRSARRVALADRGQYAGGTVDRPLRP
jgi:hypothetical protein